MPVQTASKPLPKSAASPVKVETMKVARSASPAQAKAAPTKPLANEKKAGDKKVEAASKPVTRPVRMAKNDPLAPLPARANPKKTAKDTGTAR
jgi:hypothetical protein